MFCIIATELYLLEEGKEKKNTPIQERKKKRKERGRKKGKKGMRDKRRMAVKNNGILS